MDAMDVATCKNWSKIHKTELLLILASEKKESQQQYYAIEMYKFELRK